MKTIQDCVLRVAYSVTSRMQYAVVALVVVGIITGCSGQTEAGSSVPMQVGEGEIKVGNPAPSFVLNATDGTVLDLEQLKGKAVVINFWATWCGPCRNEMPEIEAVYQDLKSEGLQVIAVEVRSSGDEEASRQFLSEVGATFPNVRDSNRLMEQAFVKNPAYPTTFFIDRDGVIQYVQVGPMNAAFIKERLDALGF